MGIRVLSLFDGISCGQLALERAGITVEKYYASEVDKYAMAVAQYNYPDTIQLGDVKEIDGKKLGQIDLLFR
jgi:DNA (cytosine-5)-methyltransferase 3A